MLVNSTNIFFIEKKDRKDTLKSFRINWPTNSQWGFKISHTQLIKDNLNIHFEENCLTKKVQRLNFA